MKTSKYTEEQIAFALRQAEQHWGQRTISPYILPASPPSYDGPHKRTTTLTSAAPPCQLRLYLFLWSGKGEGLLPR
jgi:hypothetical protein